jgi:hypothetical protein
MTNSDLIQCLICGAMMMWIMGSLSWAIFRLCTYNRIKGFPRRYITAGETADAIIAAQRARRFYNF